MGKKIRSMLVQIPKSLLWFLWILERVTFIVSYASRGEKNTVNLNTNSNISFCGTYGCSNLSFSSYRWVFGKQISKNPNDKSNDDGDEEDEDNNINNDNNNDNDGNDDETLRRGYCVKRFIRHIVRVPFEGEERGGRGSRIRGPIRPFAS